MLSIQKTPELDLHGVLHEDVPKKIDKFVYENRHYSGIGYIITGKSLQMKSIVKETLKLYFPEQKDSPFIINSGRIQINFS